MHRVGHYSIYFIFILIGGGGVKDSLRCNFLLLQKHGSNTCYFNFYLSIIKCSKDNHSTGALAGITYPKFTLYACHRILKYFKIKIS